MAFDGLVLAAVKNELQMTIVGGRVEKIYQPLPREIHFLIRQGKTRLRLLVSADARDGRVHLTRQSRENPPAPPLFCMVLRKHLEGGKITGLDQPGLERVLRIMVEAVDELGRLAEKTLVCEVMGKHSNIILVDPASNMILDGINRYSSALSRYREVLPGRRYIPPPEPGKFNPLEATEEIFRSALWDPDRDTGVATMILDKFAGFSPQTCREITVRAGLDPAVSNQYLGETELVRLWQAFRIIRDRAVAGRFAPTVCYQGGRPVAFAAFELTQFPEAGCRAGPISEILDEFFSARERQEQFSQAAADLQKTVRHEIKKCQKKIALHQESLKQAEDAERFKILGELIKANIFQLPAGSSSAELVNYLDPAGEKVVVPMDPQLSPAENAQAYFKKYTKARHIRVIASRCLDQTGAELAYLESVMMALDQAERPGDLAEIKAELIKEGYRKPETVPRGTKKPGPGLEPSPLRFKSADGLEILVGRNNRQNDYITMKMARPDDIWLHVKDIPGSHVIIRSEQAGEVPGSTLLQAAGIAAFYSRARQSAKVAVDYTRRKHVRKPKGAKPGMVVYDNQKTVLVAPKGECLKTDNPA